MSTDEYANVKEAASELGVSEATIWNLLRTRNIDRYRFPGSRETKIKREDLDRLRQPVKLESPQRGRPRGATQAKKLAA